jgi:putative exporter of polyketide antibiotics
MNPDVFITLAFTTFVVLLAIPAVAVMVRMVRRERRTDDSSDPSASTSEQPRAVAIMRATAASDTRKGVR